MNQSIKTKSILKIMMTNRIKTYKSNPKKTMINNKKKKVLLQKALRKHRQNKVADPFQQIHSISRILNKSKL